MYITATELKTNISKYLALAETEDIIVTKNNKPIVKLTNIRDEKLSILDSLVGIVPDNGMSLEDYRDERMIHYMMHLGRRNHSAVRFTFLA